MAGSLKKHNWLQDRLFNDPSIINIDVEELKVKTTEYGLYYNGHIFVQPDIYMLNGKHHYIEIKSGNNPQIYSKGMAQLEKIAFWNDKYNIKNYDAFMAMAPKKNTRYWVQMLENLDIYRLGDTYRKK